MTQGIFRAGPFTDGVTPYQTTGVPVNPARDNTSTSWLWRYRLADDTLGTNSSLVTGFPDYDEAVTDPGVPAGGTGASEIVKVIEFYYQAVLEFNMELAYTLNAGGVGAFSSSVSISVTGADAAFSDSNSGRTATLSGTETLAFPPTIIPRRVTIEISALAVTQAGAGSGSTSASVDVTLT